MMHRTLIQPVPGWRPLATIAATAILFAGCSSDIPAGDAGTTPTQAVAAASDGGSSVPELAELCEQPFTVPGLDIEAAVGIPLPDGIADELALDAQGVGVIVDLMGPGIPHICTLEASPWVVAAVAAIDEAGAAGDTAEVSRLLEQLISVDIQAWAPMIEGISAHEGVDHEQRSRDYQEAADAASRNGDDEAANDAYYEAGNEYSEYVNDTIGNTTDPQTLMDMAETSAYYGNTEDTDALLQKILEHREKELAPIVTAYEPCTANAEQTGTLVDAAAGVLILGGDADDALGKLLERMDIWERRQKGEAVPECDAYSFHEEQPLGSGWDGTMTLDLQTCDGITWTGMRFVEGVLDTGGGRMSLVSSAPISVTLPDPTGEASADIEIPLNVSIKVEGGSGSVSGTGAGTVTIKVDPTAMTAQVTVTTDPYPAMIEMTIDGHTVTMPFTVNARNDSISGPIEQMESCG